MNTAAETAGAIMAGYYSEKLSGERLRACYELAPPRVKQYLQAEIAFVVQKTAPSMMVLELGCGYGRVLRELAPRVRVAVGIDTSLASLKMANEFLTSSRSVYLAALNAARLGFADHAFDMTICIQNGISAFAVDQEQLFAETVRVTRTGGIVLFSTYAECFWNHRLEWFEAQAAHGLIGEIDHQATGNGVIVCKDGFRATTVDTVRFRRLAGKLGLKPRIIEVDNSSLFCEVIAQ